MAFAAYIVECADGTLYTGSTSDIEKRLREHNEGTGAKYTRGRGPVVLRYLEEAATRGAALSREAALKRLSRSAKLALIARSGRA